MAKISATLNQIFFHGHLVPQFRARVHPLTWNFQVGSVFALLCNRESGMVECVGLKRIRDAGSTADLKS